MSQMNQPSIKTLVISGLHDQLDVSLRFSSGLNIIFGKNGRGKTTVLHVLANILERDFARFRNLQFQQIVMETHAGDVLTVVSESISNKKAIHVEVNGQATTTFMDDSSKLTEAEESLLQQVLGNRSVYLPAFRSILERVVDPYRFSSDQTVVRQREFERIVMSERAVLRQHSSASGIYRSPIYMRRDDQASTTAVKTVQCREWFGPFVPVVRYPSLTDVGERLSAEFREASYEMASIEQRVFAESFTGVFDAIASSESLGEQKSTTELLKDVQSAIGRITSKDGDEDGAVYGKILSAVRRIKQQSQHSDRSATNRVLALYAELLQRRSDEQERLFSKIEEFEGSVNKFLDGKKLVIAGAPGQQRHRGPVVASGKGRPLSLSSLSSGERQVLTMIFSASRMGQDNGIFLVDEPELSLHIDWQRDILSEVLRQAGGRQVIACTHSPEVGAEHPDAVQFFEPSPSAGRTAGIDSEDELVDE